MNKKMQFTMIIIEFIVLIGLCSYRIYDILIKDNNSINDNEKDKEENISNLEELDINSDLIKNLVDPVSNDFFFAHYTENKFLDKNFDIETVNNKQRLAVVFNYVLQNFNDGKNILIDVNDINPDGKSYKIKEGNFKDYYNKLFGPEIEFIPETIGFNTFGCKYENYDYENSDYKIEYDNIDGTFNWFVGNGGCGAFPGNNYFISEIIKAETTGNEIFIYYYVYQLLEDFIEDNCVIKNINKKENIGEIRKTKCKENTEILKVIKEEINELKQQNNLPMYKLTFKKQSDGNYYFAKGEWQ